MYEAEYKSKLMKPEAAVRLIPARGTLSMGMAISEPPALLQALERRIKAREIENLRVYYSHSAPAAMMTILRYEYMDVIKPHPFFPTIVERELARRGARRNAGSCPTCRAISVACHGFWPKLGSTLSW